MKKWANRIYSILCFKFILHLPVLRIRSGRGSMDLEPRIAKFKDRTCGQQARQHLGGTVAEKHLALLLRYKYAKTKRSQFRPRLGDP